MKKSIFILVALLAVTFSYGKTIEIHKKGGKACKGNSSAVCYRTVDVSDSEMRYEQSCIGRGPNSCPKVGIVSLGTTAFDLENFLVGIESAIISGSNSANGVILDSQGAVIATYHWAGLINLEGNIEYDLYIDETN